MTRRMIMSLLAAAMVAVGFAGCKDAKDGSATKDKAKLVISVIPKGTAHVFWQSVHAGANRAARELGIPDPIWKGPATENDRGAQISTVEDLLTKGADAMVLAPVDQTALRPVADTVASKMPIVIFDSGLAGTDKYTAFVRTDNERGGQIAAEHMLKLLGDAGGKVIMVKVQENSDSTMRREKGFLEVIKKNPKVQVIDAGYSDSLREKAREKAADALTNHPDVKGVYGPNESSAMGILMALKEKKLEGKVRFVGFDSSDELAAALDAGAIDALILQDPVQMGYLAVKAAYAAINKEKVEKDQLIKPQLVTKENKDQPAIREVLRPDLSKDLGPRK